MKARGFTLLEMSVTLFILGLLLVVSFVAWPPIRDSQAETYFFRQFETDYQNLLTTCMFAKNNGQLMVGTSVIFNLNDSAGQPKTTTLKMPKTLKLMGKQATYVISDEGMAKPGTISFRSTRDQRIYRYKIQMGWGKLHVQTS